MLGKQKCKALKEIRMKIANANDIPYVVSRCTYKGECNGTCPRCEEELLYLEKELEKRRKMGLAIAIAGISIGACALVSKCSNDVSEVIKVIEGSHEDHGAVVAPLPAVSDKDE